MPGWPIPTLRPFALVLALGACAAPEAPEQDGFADRFDDRGYDVIDIELGESLRGLEVERLSVDPSSATFAELSRAMIVLRLPLPANQSASIVMRGDDPGFDSYLMIRDGETGEPIDASDDQTLVANIDERDALVSLPKREFRNILIFATGGMDMQSAGRFTIDIIAHPDPLVDFSASGPVLRTYASELRRGESNVAEWYALGVARESESGLLERQDDAADKISLQELAELTSGLRAVNTDREELFDAMVEVSGNAEASRESVGRAAALIYQRTRELP